MAGVPGSPSAERPDNEEEVAEDGHHDGDHVEGDPPGKVGLVQVVGPTRCYRCRYINLEKKAKINPHLDQCHPSLLAF